MKHKLFITVLLVTLCGCSLATRSDVIQNNMRRDFKSAKTPEALAICIDRKADDSFLNSLHSKITSIAGQPIEVLVHNGNSVYAVIKIEADGEGSRAIVYLGGAALFTPDSSTELLTKDCE